MYLKHELYELIRTDESIFDFIQESTLDGLWYWDLEQPENEWMNPKFWKVLGYNPDEMAHTPSSWHHIINQDDLKLALENFTQHFENPDQPFDQNVRYKHKDGSTVWIRCRGLAIRDENGKPLRMLGAHVDITNIKKSELELLESKQKAENNEARYRTLFENMNTGFVLFEMVQNEQGIPVDLIILAANKRFEETTGLNLKDAMGKYLTKVLPGIEKDEADWIGTYSKVALTGESIQYEQGSELLGYYYSISAFPAGPKQCAVTFLDITERKFAEEKLIESESRFRKLYENGANGMVMVGKDFKFFMANPTFCKMTGYQENELQQLTFVDITYPDDRAKDIPHVKKMMAGEIDVYRTEKRYLTKNSQTFWVDLTVSPIYDSNGRFLYFVGIIVNITERKTAEKKLTDSEKRLRLATEQANVAVWEYDFKTNIMSRSGNHDTLYGMEWQNKADINTFLNVTHPEDRDYSNQMIMNSVVPDGPDNYSFEFKVIFPDESIRWLLVHGQVIERDEYGQGIMVRGTLADITEIKRTELALRESETRYRNILECAPIGITIIQKGKIVFVNPAGLQIVGAKSIKCLIGKEITNIIHPANLDESRKRLQQLMNGKKRLYPAEEKYVRFDGKVIDVEIIATLLTYKDKPAVQVIISDITERMRLSKEMEQLNTELELKVKQRTALLEASNKELEFSNKELEAFSYSVSHDLRAPLRHINGYVDLLNQRYGDQLPEKAHHYLETISGAASQMGTLIDDLLQYSRTGRKELNKRELDLNVLLKEVFDELRTLRKGRKINWEIQELPRVYGDPILLKLVWTNLLGNAIKYTQNKQTAEISVSCREEEESVVFSICDNGVGFDMKYAQKLFGVFQRLHSHAEFEGTGIGLANVQRIVHKHSGRVWAEAETGQGAKFYFSLPKYLEEEKS